MSVQLLLKRFLLEKECALGRRQLIGAYLGLTSTFTVTALGYSTLTYLAAEPALSRSPEEAEPAKMMLKGGTPTQSPLCEPESGVKLLVSILSRLGASSQVAMLQDNDSNRWTFKPNVWGSKKASGNENSLAASDQFAQQAPAKPAAEQQLSQALNSNVADPALTIRPQVAKRAAMDDIASLPQDKAGAYGSNLRNMQFKGKPSYKQTYTQLAAAPPPAAMPMQSTPQVYTTTNAPASQAERSQLQSSTRGLSQGSFNKSPMQYKVVSESPAIKEFGQGSRRDEALDAKTKTAGKRQINIVDEPLGRARMEHASLVEKSKELAEANGSADGVTGIIRPSEQPGLFKYVREYLKEPPKNAPASEPATFAQAPQSPPALAEGAPTATDERKAEEADYAGKDSLQKGDRGVAAAVSGQAIGGLASGGAGGAGGNLKNLATFDMEKSRNGYSASNFSGAGKKKHASPVQIAFLPPNAVHGISGLNLGASTAEVNAFFKSKGKYTKQGISGFQIYTLKGEHGYTTLQAFVRFDRLEALRVFSTAYVPTQVGVNLGEELPSMKAQFGEPAFILEEPRANANTPPMVAKNYVYPVSQVSFQLARRSGSSTPVVLSMLLFRFL